MKTPTTQSPFSRSPLAQAYSELIFSGARQDHTLSNVGLTTDGLPSPILPLHWATLRVLAALSRTADEEGKAALLACLQELYTAPSLRPAQLDSLLSLVVRTDDLTCAEGNRLLLLIDPRGQVSTDAHGHTLQFSGDWWHLPIGSTRAHHLHLGGAVAQARTFARPRQSRSAHAIPA